MWGRSKAREESETSKAEGLWAKEMISFHQELYIKGPRQGSQEKQNEECSNMSK